MTVLRGISKAQVLEPPGKRYGLQQLHDNCLLDRL